MKDIPSVEGRNAAWALFSHQPNEAAERILIQAGLVYRAIELNMQLNSWTSSKKIAQSILTKNSSRIQLIDYLVLKSCHVFALSDVMRLLLNRFD